VSPSWSSTRWPLNENHIPEEIAWLRRNLSGMLARLDVLERSLRVRTDIYRERAYRRGSDTAGQKTLEHC
jgi:hypothetical protein